MRNIEAKMEGEEGHLEIILLIFWTKRSKIFFTKYSRRRIVVERGRNIEAKIGGKKDIWR